MDPQAITKKVLELSEHFNHYVLEHPEILDSLPDRAVLVFLDADDQPFNAANVEVAAQSPLPTDAERIYIQLRRRVQLVEQVNWEAEIVPAPSP